jgi:TetR/AcrR family transcriptional regulator
MKEPARKNPGEITRTAILDATEQLMREEGYAAVSSRKIAAKAGLKSQLVYYYYKTMSDLFLALHRRTEERHFRDICTAMASKEPLMALWKFSIDPDAPRLNLEFLALSTHHEQLRIEIARASERTRSMYQATLSRVINEHSIDEKLFPPEVFTIILQGVARLLSSSAVDSSVYHDEAAKYVENIIRHAGALPKA